MEAGRGLASTALVVTASTYGNSERFLYAETGVIEYWVADIPNDCVWTHSEIQDNAYRMTRQFRRGEWIEPKLLAECRIPVDALHP